MIRLDTKALTMLFHLLLPLEGDTSLSRRCCCFLLPNITGSEGMQPSYPETVLETKGIQATTWDWKMWT